MPHSQNIKIPSGKILAGGIYFYLYIDLTTMSNFLYLLILEVNRQVEFFRVVLLRGEQVRHRGQFLLREV